LHPLLNEIQECTAVIVGPTVRGRRSRAKAAGRKTHNQIDEIHLPSRRLDSQCHDSHGLYASLEH
jgi:hypothetical protein